MITISKKKKKCVNYEVYTKEVIELGSLLAGNFRVKEEVLIDEK